MPINPIFDSIVQQFLRYSIIDTPYIYIDLWSIIHLSSGLIIGLLLAIFYKNKHAWIFALTMFVGYEVIELFLIGIIFTNETKIDIIWDLIIGMIGFFISYKIIKR